MEVEMKSISGRDQIMAASEVVKQETNGFLSMCSLQGQKSAIVTTSQWAHHAYYQRLVKSQTLEWSYF